jgi:adenylosuccinate lyase
VRIRECADIVCMAFTHLQPAEPTTLGYRFAVYAQDLLIDRDNLQFVFENLTAKGLRGAVGTSASYEQLLSGESTSATMMEEEVLQHFGLHARDVSTQTYPRKLDYLLLSALAGTGASLSKFAADVRILSSPEFGEVFEPFGKSQVGSSAMPFKRNPIICERIDSLARLLPAYADVAWQNAANNYLERTLDDSANRRTILPEALLCLDEIVRCARRVVEGLRIDMQRIAQNLRTYGPFAGTEPIMMEAVRAGGDRQALHEVLRTAAMESWQAIAQGKSNPLGSLLTEEPELTGRVDPAEIRRMLDPSKHTGSAPARALALAARIEALQPFPSQKEVDV